MATSFNSGVAQVVAKGYGEGITQFSFIADGRKIPLGSILNFLSSKDITILALSFLENSDSTIVRTVVNYPDEVSKNFSKKGIFFIENKVLAAEVSGVNEISKLLNSVISAEVKINYAYPLLARPNGKVGLILHTENDSFAASVFSRIGAKILSQSDLGR